MNARLAKARRRRLQLAMTRGMGATRPPVKLTLGQALEGIDYVNAGAFVTDQGLEAVLTDELDLAAALQTIEGATRFKFVLVPAEATS